MKPGQAKAIAAMGADEILATNEALKKNGGQVAGVYLKMIDAFGRIVMIFPIVIKAVVNGAWLGLRETVDEIGRGMREIERGSDR